MPTQKEKSQEQEDQLRNIRQRESLNNAYAAIVGQQSVQSFAAYTFEEALDAQIERIEGKDSAIRPNLLNRVEKIRGNVLKAVEEIRTVDPSAFLLPNEDEDVNTPQDQE